MSEKKYKRRKQIPNTLRCYYGVAAYSNEAEIVYNWGAGCKSSDGRLLDLMFNRARGENPSFIDELISRGYDLTTLEFSIKKK